MATWQQQLRKASFRGVPFEVQAHTTEGGRRVVVHEFPQQDTPYVEDMGKQGRKFALECWVIGDDFSDQRNAILKALEATGPGKLVHPWLGEMQVQVTGFSLSEEPTKGRKVEFRVSFSETGLQVSPSTTVSSTTSALAACDNLNAAAVDNFANDFDVVGPSYILSSVMSAVSDFSDAISTAAGLVNDVSGFVAEAAAFGEGMPGSLIDAAGLGGAVASLMAFFNVLDDLGSPASISNTVDPSACFSLGMTLADRYSPVAPQPVGVMVIGTTFLPDSYWPAGYVTASRQQQADSVNAFNRLVAIQGLTVAGNAALATTYTSYTDAITARDTLAAQVDILVDSATNAAEFQALRSFRATLVQYLNTQAMRSPKVYTVTYLDNLPSFVVAHKLYGDATKVDAVTARNPCQNTMFMPLTIEALTD
jgi:prophage DNA circulation protein